MIVGLQKKGRNMEVERLSLITTPIHLLENGVQISQGTGFYYIHPWGENNKRVVFLVTNYHVLNYVAPNSSDPRRGDSITIKMHFDENEPADCKSVTIPLFFSNGKPKWLQSSTFSDADLVCLPLEVNVYKETFINGIGRKWLESNLKLRPGSNVSLIGYPYGYFDDVNNLPIWKTGHIASEPDYDFKGRPYIVVDISAFPGMSGSPAFAISNGGVELDTGDYSLGSMKKFIGVYASNMMRNTTKFLEQMNSNTNLGIKDQISLQLGHIWKSSLIVDIIDGSDMHSWMLNNIPKLP